MNSTINISNTLFTRLESHASGFTTPENVIKMLLDHYEHGNLPVSPASTPKPAPKAGRDYTKYVFNGVKYGKGKLVLAVITAYSNEHPNKSFAEFLDVFPKEMEGSIGVFDTPENARKRVTDADRRFFMRLGDSIQLSNCEIVVCSQWGIANIGKFIEKAEALGYIITPT